MISYEKELNDNQLKAAKIINGPVLCIAGAGTGKTKTLTYRIANLIKYGVSSKNILSITFTNKARDEMKIRLIDLLGYEKIDKITISTFHSLCARILRKEIHNLGYKNDFVIIDETEQLKIIKDLIKKNDMEFDISVKKEALKASLMCIIYIGKIKKCDHNNE